MHRSTQSLTRRQLLQSAGYTLALASRPVLVQAASPCKPQWPQQVGITTSSLGRQLAGDAQGRNFSLLELPRILRDELDMAVIDLNTSSLASTKPAYLERLRRNAADAGCRLTNLKLNQRDLDMNNPDRDIRERALRAYERSIDAAALLGLKWARPLPRPDRPDMKIHVASYRRLADYAAQRKIVMLVENYGWMQSDPNSVVELVKMIGDNVAAGPDTGNWNSNAIRYQALETTFPSAVTCDFKARKLGPAGAHAEYDLRRCFRIGWKAGFRGPWCLEHANRNTSELFRELVWLRDLLRTEMRTQPAD